MQKVRSSNPCRKSLFCKITENAVKINNSMRFIAFTAKRWTKNAVKFFIHRLSYENSPSNLEPGYNILAPILEDWQSWTRNLCTPSGSPYPPNHQCSHHNASRSIYMNMLPITPINPLILHPFTPLKLPTNLCNNWF